VNTCIYDAFGKGVSVSASVYVCLSHDNLKTIADIYSTFCLLVTYTRAISRTISHVKITGKGQGHFSDGSRSLGKVMSYSIHSFIHLFIHSNSILERAKTTVESEVILSRVVRHYLRWLHFCRVMLCKRGLCRHAVSVCLSVCLSRSYIVLKRVIVFSKLFHHWVAKPCWFLRTKRHGNIPTGIPLTGRRM